jgi:hypothetical protein
MSDSESFESHTDTEQSTDNEDVVEPQSSVLQPYQFEPVADIATNDYEEDETGEDGLEARFTKTVAVSSW